MQLSSLVKMLGVWLLFLSQPPSGRTFTRTFHVCKSVTEESFFLTGWAVLIDNLTTPSDGVIGVLNVDVARLYGEELWLVLARLLFPRVNPHLMVGSTWTSVNSSEARTQLFRRGERQGQLSSFCFSLSPFKAFLNRKRLKRSVF